MADLFDLAAKLTLDSSEYEQGLNSALGKITSIGGTIAKVGTAAVGAAAAGIGAVVKQSVSAFGEYEQLVGGVETLFGDSAQQVIADSQAAFQTAGMSMNDYMETSIQSAAALINSLDGDQAQAATLMNMSITDMADNVNKMGTTMDAVQNAYRGFSRGNFTMLDNLALGFAGTKEGMQELLDKAQEISGVEYDISSYSDIVEAIHVVQTEMGITETTANEAASTIQGSIGSMKAAWENLVTGISDPNADIGGLIQNLVETAGTALGNLMPTINQALTGIGTAITALAPVLAETFTGLVQNVLPSLVQAAMSLIESLGSALIDNAPQLFDSALAIVTELVNGIAQMAPSILPAAATIISELALALTNPGTLSGILQSGLAIITGLADGLIQAVGTLAQAAPVIISNLVTFIVANLPLIIETGLKLVQTLTEGIIQNLEPLLDGAIQIMTTIVNGVTQMMPELIPLGFELIMTLFTALVNNLPLILDAGIKVLESLVEGILSMINTLMDTGIELIDKLFDTIVDAAKKLIDAGKEMVQKIKEGFSEKVEEAKQWGRDLIDNFIGGLRQKWDNLKNTVSNIAASVKSFLGFSEPEEGPLSNFHTFAPDMMELFMKGIRDNEGALQAQVAHTFDFRDAITQPEAMTYTAPVTSTETDKTDAVLAAIEDLKNAILNHTIELDGDVVANAVNRRLGAYVSRRERV